jgi:hypothetical protein
VEMSDYERNLPHAAITEVHEVHAVVLIPQVSPATIRRLAPWINSCRPVLGRQSLDSLVILRRVVVEFYVFVFAHNPRYQRRPHKDVVVTDHRLPAHP